MVFLSSFSQVLISRFTLCTLLCVCAGHLGFGQGLSDPSASEEEAPKTVFTHRLETGLTLHTRGMGVHLERGTYRGIGKVRTWSLEVVSMKHPKEVRSFNPVYDQGKSYVFGKVNSAYIARLGWGKRTVATPKLRSGAVAMGWKYAFGPALALSKPVYLVIGYPDIPYRYLLTERYDPDIHGTGDIYGRAGPLNGLLEVVPTPGAFARVAADFEYSGTQSSLRTLSIGLNLDVFATPVVIMAPQFDQNDAFFLTLFVHWSFGRQQFKT